MARSTVVKVARDGLITLSDGAGTPLTHTVEYEEGDFSVSPEKAERVVLRDRGVIAGLRKGDDPVPTFSFSVYMRDFIDSADTTIIDVIEQTNGASSWTSTGGTGFEQFLIDVAFSAEGTDHGDAGDHTVTMTKCHLVWEFAEAKDGNKITVSGECYGTVTRAEA